MPVSTIGTISTLKVPSHFSPYLLWRWFCSCALCAYRFPFHYSSSVPSASLDALLCDPRKYILLFFPWSLDRFPFVSSFLFHLPTSLSIRVISCLSSVRLFGISGWSPNMSTVEQRRDLPDNTRPSPAPSTAGSTGTSSVTVRTGPNGHMSFRRCVCASQIV